MQSKHVLGPIGLIIWFFFWNLGCSFSVGAQESGLNWTKVPADTGPGWKQSCCLVTDDGRRLALKDKGNIVWEHEAANQDTGNICGRPVIARSNDPLHPWIVAAGNGWNSETGKAKVTVTDLATGETLATFVFDQTGENGICSLTLVDGNGDGQADSGYGGDLRGNVWKFSLEGSCSQWRALLGPFFTASCAGYRQPITAAPNVFRHCSRPGVLVCFGTGRLLDEQDSHDLRPQSLYAVWDRGDENWRLGTFDAATGIFNFPPGSIFSPSVTLLEQSFENVNDRYRTGTDFLPVWWKEDEPRDAAHLGWFIRLPGINGHAGERITSKVLVRGGTLFALSFVPPVGAYVGESAVFVLRACVGGVFFRPVFDANTDGEIDKNDCVNGRSLAARIFSGLLQDMELVEQGGKPVLQQIRQSGEKETMRVNVPKEGIFFWQQLEGM